MGTIQLIEFPFRKKMDSTISLKTKIFMGKFEWIINGILFQNKSIKGTEKKKSIKHHFYINIFFLYKNEYEINIEMSLLNVIIYAIELII